MNTDVSKQYMFRFCHACQLVMPHLPIEQGGTPYRRRQWKCVDNPRHTVLMLARKGIAADMN